MIDLAIAESSAPAFVTDDGAPYPSSRAIRVPFVTSHVRVSCVGPSDSQVKPRLPLAVMNGFALVTRVCGDDRSAFWNSATNV